MADHIGKLDLRQPAIDRLITGNSLRISRLGVLASGDCRTMVCQLGPILVRIQGAATGA